MKYKLINIFLFVGISTYTLAHPVGIKCHYYLKHVPYCVHIKFEQGRPKKNIRNKFWVKVIQTENRSNRSFEKGYHIDIYSVLKSQNNRHHLRGPKITYYPISENTYQADDARFIRTKLRGQWEIHMDIYPKESHQKIDSFIYNVNF